MVSSSFFRLTSDALLTRWRPQVSQNLVQSVGKSFWRTIRKFYLQKGNKSNQLNRSKVLEVLPEIVRSRPQGLPRQLSTSLSALPSATSRFHRILVDGILRRVTNSQVVNLRQRATRELGNGQSGSFLALLGVSLASGTGMISKEDEVNCVCSEIRQAAGKVRLAQDDPIEDLIREEELSLKSFELGGILAKGCNAVVCAARWSKDAWSKVSDAFERIEGAPDNSAPDVQDQFPLAIKMMFNYDIESNAEMIMKGMAREMIPARTVPMSDWFDELNRIQRLSPHPNIVAMYGLFTDSVPNLEGSMALFPDALPQRLNPTGLGRNKSLFLVMKRYDMSLCEYLKRFEGSVSHRTSLMILAQLLEAVATLVDNNIAHRDLKSDNILVNLSGGPESPVVVITDFGCALADSGTNMRMRYTSSFISRGGNLALMAPEVIKATPGLLTTIDFSKSDVWAIGAVAYEIFGQANPFYSGLKSSKYKMKDLPILNSDPLVEALVFGMLEKNPKRRPSAELAATICQILLWAPKKWTRSQDDDIRTPKSQEILQWALSLATKIICEARFANTGNTLNEYQLVSTFLTRFSMKTVKDALNWIHLHSIQKYQIH